MRESQINSNAVSKDGGWKMKDVCLISVCICVEAKFKIQQWLCYVCIFKKGLLPFNNLSSFSMDEQLDNADALSESVCLQL